MLLVVKGKVDAWRIDRQLSYNLYCSWVKDPISIYQYCGLPYDDELQNIEKAEVDQSLEEWYKIASKEVEQRKWN